MNNNLLPFRNVAYWKQLNEINKLDTSKPTQSEGIPFKIKDNTDIFANFNFDLQTFNQCIKGRASWPIKKKQRFFLKKSSNQLSTVDYITLAFKHLWTSRVWLNRPNDRKKISVQFLEKI